MRTILVKVGQVPRKANSLIGLYRVQDTAELEEKVATRFTPTKCLYLDIDSIPLTLEMSGRVRTNGKVFVAGSRFCEGLVEEATNNDAWKTLDQLKEAM